MKLKISIHTKHDFQNSIQYYLETMHENEIARVIVDAAIEVHRHLGPGLLESVYEEALWYELSAIRNLEVERQKALPAVYKGYVLDKSFRVDLLVERKVIAELKSVEEVPRKHYKILLNYLQLSDLKLGLMLNFNVELMKDGVKRVVNGL